MQVGPQNVVSVNHLIHPSIQLKEVVSVLDLRLDLLVETGNPIGGQLREVYCAMHTLNFVLLF